MTRNVRRAAIAAAGSLALIGTLVGTGATAGSAQPGHAAPDGAGPVVSLLKGSDAVTAEKWGKRAWVELGVWLAANEEAFEVRATRASYREEIEAHLVTPEGNVALPEGLFRDFRGLPNFARVTVRNLDGESLVNRSVRFCPGYESVRVRPDAPDVSTYPVSCNYWHPFTLGAIYGVEEGWAVPLSGAYGGMQMTLPLGRYVASVRITETYRELLGLSRSQAVADVRLRLVKPDNREGTHPRGAPTVDTARATEAAPTQPAASEPTRAGAVPGPRYRPDLRSLPSYAIRLTKRGRLQFAATVWNAGPSPLVIDGFRRADEDVMDAYQYFYDGDRQVGYEQVGTMIWHAAEAHHHWHFTDFARYRLLDADKQGVVRSRKESFCLANTDAVDYTVPGANWRPENTDLHTACGGFSSVAVREVLDSGSGDTYYQSLPGQSFNVNNLPNGTYFIAVEANPVHNLSEVSTTNNIAYRKVILKGAGDNRRVIVPQIGIINEP